MSICDKCVHREVCCDEGMGEEALNFCAHLLEERPKGKWRSVGFEKGYAFCICSNCGNTTRLYRDSKNEFCCIADIRNKVIACLYCGADMRGEENG